MSQIEREASRNGKRQENGLPSEHLEIQPSKHLDFNTLRAVLNMWPSELYVVVQLPSHVWLFVIPWTAHTRLLCSPVSPRACSTRVHWVSDAIQPYPPASPFFCPHSFPVSESFSMSWLFSSGGQSVRAATSALVFPISIHG